MDNTKINRYQLIYELKLLLDETKDIDAPKISLLSSKLLALIDYNADLTSYADGIKVVSKEEKETALNSLAGFMYWICSENLGSNTLFDVHNLNDFLSVTFKNYTDAQKKTFIDYIDKDCYSLIELCITVFFMLSNTKQMKLDKDLQNLFNTIKQYEKFIIYNQLNLLSYTILYHKSLEDCLTLKAIIKFVIFDLIEFLHIKMLVNDSMCKSLTRSEVGYIETTNMDGASGKDLVLIPRIHQNPLSNEEIYLLRLRKTLQPNSYKAIGKKCNPSLSINNVTQKFQAIKNKLGCTSPDNCVRFYEEKYHSLDK